MTPTVGRIVWYYPQHADPGACSDGEPLAAVVSWVWDCDTVNLAVFSAAGQRFARSDVRRNTGDGDRMGTWDWMPFQKGQAAAADTPGGLMDRVARLERLVESMLPEAR